jgi:hypothetical protein
MLHRVALVKTDVSEVRIINGFFFNLRDISSRFMALDSTQLLTEIDITHSLWG